jgi:phosphate starvation-inducible protein PhoH
MSDSIALDYNYNKNYQYSEFDEYLIKKKARKERKARRNSQNGLNLYGIDAITYAQKQVFESYGSGYNLMLHGCAGTGKTFISAYLAIKDIIHRVDEKRTLHIIRSIVPTRDIGFLPGNEKEKSKVYEAPYYAIFSELFNRGDAYDILKQKDMIKFQTTSFIRGITMDDSIIVVDEAQNLNFHELDSVITRIGENSRIIFCGDFTQSDFRLKNEQNGILDFMKILSKMKAFDFVEFNKNDIVRSDLVKEYICTKMDMGMH